MLRVDITLGDLQPPPFRAWPGIQSRSDRDFWVPAFAGM